MNEKKFSEHPNFKEVKKSIPLHMNYWIYYDIERERTEKSKKHNTNVYSLSPFYKPISKIINLSDE
jgi:hypothetical protein